MTTNPAASSAPTAVITGGSRGLGFEVARGLAAQGYHLALIAKDSQRLSEASKVDVRISSVHRLNFSHRL